MTSKIEQFKTADSEPLSFPCLLSSVRGDIAIFFNECSGYVIYGEPSYGENMGIPLTSADFAINAGWKQVSTPVTITFQP